MARAARERISTRIRRQCYSNVPRQRRTESRQTSMDINTRHLVDEMKASRRTKGLHTERRNRRVTVFQARPAGLRPFMPTSYQLTTRFTKQNSKNKKAKHQEWSARGGGPDIDDKKSAGDPDLISGREKLHGCQMVKKECTTKVRPCSTSVNSWRTGRT